MRLKKLELFGFKSFADRTEVLFDEGVTCVVGPNGCGKSNISDAIRWVLGERSAKLLRGSKMEDVIFNGTDFRKSLAYSEVSLTIDNQDRGLPINYEEVTLTRRLYRSGESEYLINKTLCRLKDIQDLILDTGIGSNSYSMIEQGRIDYVLNADAEERRFLIEEAAGISKYKVKKEEALRKLERTEENLVRLNDIVQEVFRNIQYAERQAKRAERYKQQFEKLKNLEIRKAFYDLEILKKTKTELEGARLHDESEWSRLESERAKCAEDLAGLQSCLREVLETFSKEEAAAYSLKADYNQNEQQLSFNQEKRMELATRRGENKEEESHLKERLEKTQAEMETKKKDRQAFELSKNEVLAKWNASEEELKKAEEQWGSSRARLDESKIELFETAAKISQMKNEIQRLITVMETSAEQKNRLLANHERFQSERNQWHSRGEGYDRESQSVEEKLSLRAGERDGSQHRLSEIHQILKEENARKEALEKALSDRKTRMEMLREVEAEGSDRVKILEDAREFETHWVRAVREVVSVREGYAKAVEAALGAFAEAWIAENSEAAEKLFEHLHHKKVQSVGILIGDTEAPGEPEASSLAPDIPFIDCAMSEVVEVQESYKPLLVSFFKNVYVIHSPGNGTFKEIMRHAGPHRFVTKEGVSFGPAHRIFFRNGSHVTEGPFQRVHMMKELESEIGKMEGEWKQAFARMEEFESRASGIRRELEAAEVEILDLKIQKESRESLKSGLEERLSSYDRELILLDQELAEIETRQRRASQEKGALEENLRGVEGRWNTLEEAQRILVKQLEEEQALRERRVRENAEIKAQLQHLEERDVFLKEAIELLSKNEDSDMKRLAFLAEETGRIRERDEKILALDGELREKQKAIDEAIKKNQVRLEIIRQEKNSLEAAYGECKLRLEEWQQNQQAAKESLHRSDMKAMELSYQEKAVIERIEQAYHIKMQEFAPKDFPGSEGEMHEPEEGLQALESQIAELREKVNSLGTVNLLAIEEHDELKKRYDFLISQQKDMNEAKESLLQAIRQINRTTKSLFEETFVNVQKMFQEYYQTLFRGGEARLVLIDESQPLESGIDIVVRPPGKKLQHITLLSGGEKALTAIALLFALFTIKPSPFCVLDEVDAPLDEANIDRFLAVLRTFLQQSQFIIITHNRKTIAMGDSLYGVTMEEAGVSKIVSVKMKQTEGPADSPVEENESPVIEDAMTA